MIIGDDSRYMQDYSINFLKQNIGSNILILKNCFEVLSQIYLQTEARHFDRLEFVKDIADKVYASFTEEEKQTYLIKPLVRQIPDNVFKSPVELAMPFSVGLHVNFSPVPTQFAVDVRISATEHFGLFSSFSKEETFVEDAKAFILNSMEVFNPQKLAEVAERHDLPIFINNQTVSTKHWLRHRGLRCANILASPDYKHGLLKISGSYHQSVTIPFRIKEGVCVADKIDEILTILKTRQDLFKELKSIGVSDE